MDYTAAQRRLLEADETLRNLERYSDPSSLISLATNYLRTGDPRFKRLIHQLRETGSSEGIYLIQQWAKMNDVPTTDQLMSQLTAASKNGLDMSKAESMVLKAQYSLEHATDEGRSGYWYGVALYKSPIDDNYIWLVEGDEEGDHSFNYGTISQEDLNSAVADYGERDWEGWGMLDYFRDYLY
jgi:hypothetical protein